MRISEVRVKLVEDRSDKLQAFCTITLDGDFVVRDIKIIEGTKGPFVAMPSRKLMDRCRQCGIKNHLRSKFCNECGTKLSLNRTRPDSRGRERLHTDIAHPINAEAREFIGQAILESFYSEVERSKKPDYVSPNIEDFDDGSYYRPVEKQRETEAGQGS